MSVYFLSPYLSHITRSTCVLFGIQIRDRHCEFFFLFLLCSIFCNNVFEILKKKLDYEGQWNYRIRWTFKAITSETGRLNELRSVVQLCRDWPHGVTSNFKLFENLWISLLYFASLQYISLKWGDNMTLSPQKWHMWQQGTFWLDTTEIE